MKRIFVPMLVAVLLLATDRPGVRPRGPAKDYPAYDSADGITIAAAVIPAAKVQHQLSREMVKAGYIVLEIAVYPGPGLSGIRQRRWNHDCRRSDTCS